MKQNPLRLPAFAPKWAAEGIVFFFGFLTLNFLDWPQLRYWRVKGPGGRFEDLQSILQAGDCFRYIGNEVFRDTGGCTGYMYGRFLLQTLNFLHIHQNQYQVIGIAFLFLLSFTFAFLYKSVDFKFSSLFKAAIIFSPPVVLLAERGNFDIFIFLLIFAGAVLFVKNLPEIAILPIIIASLMKFYTLPSLFGLLLLNFRMRTKFVMLATSIFVSYLIIQDFGRVQVGFRQFWYAQFGMSVWGRYANEVRGFHFNELTITLIGLFIFGATIFLVSRISRIPKTVLPTDRSPFQAQNIMFFLLFSTHLACFALGMSYDYRLIFIIGASGALLNSGCMLSKDQVRKVVVVLTTLVWCSYNSGQLQILGNLILEFITAWYVLITFSQLKHLIRKD